MTTHAISGTTPPQERAIDLDELVIIPLVRAHLLAALGFMLVAMLAGLLFSLQLVQSYFFAGSEIMSPGRWRLVHTQGVAYGFITNAFLGLLHWSVPRLTLRPVLSRWLSWFIFYAWQGVVLATVVGVLVGQAQAVEWGETPVWIDPIALLGLVLVAINFLSPILQVRGPMYVSLWYFLAAFVWTVLVYAMGSFIPQYFVGGAASGAIIGLFIHDLVGLFVTPIGWGLMYYFVPILLKKPIWSHGLSLVGFWGLAFFYPLTGIHHFLYSPIPMFLQYGAVISTIAVEFVVATVIINFQATIRHREESLKSNLPIRWFYLGMAFYFTTCLQCAFQATLTFQKIIHFSDWVVGHSHLVMFGVFGFWILGGMTYLFPRVLGASGWWKPSLNIWHFWLTGIGMLIMFFDLVIAGLIQGYMWRNLSQWETTLQASYPFWYLRTITGVMIIAGQLAFTWNVIMTAIVKGPAASRSAAILPEAGGLAPA